MFLGMNGPLCALGRRNEYELEWRGIRKGFSGSSLHKGDLVSFQGVMEILSSLGACVSNPSIALFLFLMMPKVVLGKFSVIGPAGPIQAPLGGEAELPCYLSPPQSAQNMEVVWLQSTQVVHLYRDGEDQFGDQAPDYQGRTELVRDAITSGNVTLKIRDVRLLDEGKYTCLIADGFYQEEADMELKVLGDEPESAPEQPILFIILWVGVFLIFLSVLVFLLCLQGSFYRSVPGLCEISRILIVTLAFEVEVSLYFLWVHHRCIGYFSESTSKSYVITFVVVAMLLLFKMVPIFLLIKFVITPYRSLRIRQLNEALRRTLASNRG